MENRNGLIVDAEVFQANGTAERDALLIMMEKVPGMSPLTVGGDKGFDTFGFVEECRNLRVTPHVAQNLARTRGVCHRMAAPRRPPANYAISQKKRETDRRTLRLAEDDRIMRKVRHRGVSKVHWIFTLACAAYNLVRMRNLAVAAPVA